MSADIASEEYLPEPKLARPRSKISNVLKMRDFCLLWVGQAAAALGNQFYAIALPWLVLQLTGARETGAVLALASLPRAVFMLIGGAIIDRFSSRVTMLVSDGARAVLLAALAALTLSEVVEVWMLYAFALALGLAEAFLLPAQYAIVPQVVGKGNAQAGNTVMQGTIQFSKFAAPWLAGALIVLFAASPDAMGDVTSRAVPLTTNRAVTLVVPETANKAASEDVPEMTGIGITFALNALALLASVATLWLMRARQPQPAGGVGEEISKVLASIKAGLRYIWQSPPVRTLFAVLVVLNFCFNGPVFVGIAVLADARLPEGAVAYGAIMSVFGGGNLLGTILFGALPKPAPRYMRALVTLIFSLYGCGLICLGLAGSTGVAALAMFVVGMGNGYAVLLLVTWLQVRAPEALVGRLMSLMLFVIMGLMPVSTALTGVLIDLSITGLFVGAGALLMLVTVWAVTRPEMREAWAEMADAV